MAGSGIRLSTGEKKNPIQLRETHLPSFLKHLFLQQSGAEQSSKFSLNMVSLTQTNLTNLNTIFIFILMFLKAEAASAKLNKRKFLCSG